MIADASVYSSVGIIMIICAVGRTILATTSFKLTVDKRAILREVGTGARECRQIFEVFWRHSRPL
jgi:hypothetical protein